MAMVRLFVRIVAFGILASFLNACVYAASFRVVSLDTAPLEVRGEDAEGRVVFRARMDELRDYPAPPNTLQGDMIERVSAVETIYSRDLSTDTEVAFRGDRIEAFISEIERHEYSPSETGPILVNLCVTSERIWHTVSDAGQKHNACYGAAP